MKVAPIGVKSVEIDGVVLNETCKLTKDVRSNFSVLVINNALSVNFKPSNSQKVNVHITSVYKSMNGEIITVHERTTGNITSVLNEYGNSIDCPSSYIITIENVGDFEYTMEVMTDMEKVEKEIKELKEENKSLKNTLDKLLTGLSVISKLQ